MPVIHRLKESHNSRARALVFWLGEAPDNFVNLEIKMPIEWREQNRYCCDMLRFTRLFLIILSLALSLGSAGHGFAEGMDLTMSAAGMTAGEAMGDCDTCTGKTVKSSALCDVMCSAPAAVALDTSAGLDAFPLLADHGMIPEVRAVGRVPAVDLSPPRTITLI